MHIQLDKVYRIYSVIAAIPYGNVISYGDVAQLADLPHNAHLVGWVLKKRPLDRQLPWY
ncbi:MAG: MGMT family protein [Candidatus Schmidhempelia sp.]|nr:MGMT family protein [Candidatus Schmidhempelia sp.]